MKKLNLKLPFTQLYDRFYQPILKFVRKKIRHQHEAEELTQDIFLKIYQGRDLYNPQYSASTWVWTIARNTLTDYFRRPKATLTELDEEELITTETAETLILEKIDEKLEKTKWIEAMTNLSEKQKEALFLRLVKRFSYQEISNQMNLSLSAVKSLLHRSKEAMVSGLQHHPA